MRPPLAARFLLTAGLFVLAVPSSAQQPDASGAPPPPEASLDFFAAPWHPQADAYTALPARELRPGGWIRAMLAQDLHEGFVGWLDQLVPRLFGDDDCFASARRMNPQQIPSAGTQKLTGAEWELSMQWWGGETQGNWWEGYVRTAFLTGDEAAIARSRAFVRHILDSQDADGYLGIYGPAMRYRHPGENGELWAQTTLFRTLLAYHEYTGDPEVLRAVVRAMDLTMARYGECGANPFAVKKDYGGVSHGLMLTDVCDTLARLTGDGRYLRYAVYLYREFSRSFINPQFADARYAALIDPAYKFIGHGAHTYEHLRSLLLATRVTGYPELARAYDGALRKLAPCLLPGGAGIGDEWVAGRAASADRTAAEFCGMLELRNFYTSALQKTGDPAYADRAETLTFNDMVGARSADGRGLTYCKTDNCYRLDRHSPRSDYREEDVRYKYSPTHDDAAVCCNPNYGKDLPYYVASMWLRAPVGFAAVLYGPVTLASNWQGVPVEVCEETAYPFSDEIEFRLTVGRPVEFALRLRQPSWTTAAQVDAPGAKVEAGDGWIVVHKTWHTGDRVRLSLRIDVRAVAAGPGEVALRRGALVYALPIPGRTEVTRTYPVAGFTDFVVHPTDESFRTLALGAAGKAGDYGFRSLPARESAGFWSEGGPSLAGPLRDTVSGKVVEAKLVPLGGTMLRRVTFATAPQP